MQLPSLFFIQGKSCSDIVINIIPPFKRKRTIEAGTIAIVNNFTELIKN